MFTALKIAMLAAWDVIVVNAALIIPASLLWFGFKYACLLPDARFVVLGVCILDAVAFIVCLCGEADDEARRHSRR